MSTRVRFAPSPTGYLHIGGARTALFNWLYARHTGGKFILRIEDTDAQRNTQEAVDVILEGLRWLGIDWDEGPLCGCDPSASKGEHGPYFQSQRADIYRAKVEELKSKGFAYDRDGAVYFKMGREATLIEDLVVGEVRRELTDREALDPDFVIVRSDGQPVFHLVNVIDDMLMEITHVIRGEDHLTNTAKHIALFKAFGAEPPKYAHIPLILNSDGSKMSKRDEGASLMAYPEMGYLPEALINQLVLLGWTPGDNKEIVSVEEIIRSFDLPQVHRSNARFDMNKLKSINYEYMRQLSMEEFVEQGRKAFEKAGMLSGDWDEGYVTRALETCKDKVKTFAELPEYAGFYFVEELRYDPELLEEVFTEEGRERLAALGQRYTNLEDFSAASLEAELKALAKELGLKAGPLVHPLRLALTGAKSGPSLYHLMEVLGKERVLKRINGLLK
ncbi:MAG: glutamate--tRNA ligase [Limisphaerales bacterium]|jgi:glutamyl-tRNA synthetase|nr:glutamate--tRNA ligase [Verrucomicrobiota bacterium]